MRVRSGSGRAALGASRDFVASPPNPQGTDVAALVTDLLQIHIDGGSRGNPGDAGYGVYVQDEVGADVARLYGYLGVATNNVAEYQGLINGLMFALEHGARRVRVFSDSELVVRQIEGRYKV